MPFLDEYKPECWTDVETVLNAGVDRLILHGPPGTGKTFAALTTGAGPLSFRLECTENMTEFDIVGGFMPTGEGTWAYKNGQAVKAWVGDGLQGGRLVVDEIDKASGDILALLLAMTDSPDSCQWEHPETGKKLRPAPGYSVVMTTNIMELDQLEPALKDRFPVAIHIDKPHPAAIAQLPGHFQRYAVKTVGEISLRSWQAIAKLETSVGLYEALRLILGAEKARQWADDIAVDQVA